MHTLSWTAPPSIRLSVCGTFLAVAVACRLFSLFSVPAAGASGEESGPARLNGIRGESVTFSPVVPTGTRVINIAWNAKTTIAIVEPGKQASPQVIDQRYRGRLRVPDGGYSLQITDLSQEDTGTYTAQISIAGTTDPIIQRFALHVYSKSRRTKVTDSVRTVNGTCNVTLNCTLQGGGEDVTYTWNQPAESSPVSGGASILISHRLGSGVSPVTCTARNPVSNSSKLIFPQKVCEGNILQLIMHYLLTGKIHLLCKGPVQALCRS
uniref:Ig-like domain-containing protein n=1 Tax=Chelydra serpentina TaxID=8475 RepID=A0A8C3SSK1_CHESE